MTRSCDNRLWIALFVAWAAVCALVVCVTALRRLAEVEVPVLVADVDVDVDADALAACISSRCFFIPALDGFVMLVGVLEDKLDRLDMLIDIFSLL